MPLEPASFSAAVWGSAATYLPPPANPNAAIRSNPTMGIVPHNPIMTLVTTVASTYATTLLATPVTGTYVGVTGAIAAGPPTAIVMPAAPAAAATFQASMGWVGAMGTPLAQLFTTEVFLKTMSLGMIQLTPLPGAAVGAWTVIPATLASFGAAFSGALTGALTATGFFSPGDTKAGLTPQIALLVTNLTTAYVTALTSIVCVVPTGGLPVPSAPPTPLTIPTAPGVFI